ncbi:branched-chain amino acid ABC transporter permease [Oribacterium sp. WCC10]|uniref:branched-chain amino acid ABC transporter permease n=1 Tax=Oribacterium sp. WCC10 TaxID=1855343 RepID=UPI0008EE2B8C|nr:branched-chain amino acid ABC transporter permease [Oribacterium sp. WCC10]SFG62490.1 amino acid/amide ABC transporter membrane protein 1, HAAT family [Oribacterium sp. WCC10]
MTSAYFISQLMNGLCLGAIYALIALGVAVIIGIVGFATFTQGEVVMMGAYISFYVFLYGGNHVIPGILGSFIATWVLGMIIYKICYARFLDAPEHISLICTIGFSMLLKNIALIFFGADKKPMLNVIKSINYHFGPITVSNVQLLILGTVLILVLILSFVFTKTDWGIRLKAVSQNREAAALIGIDVEKTAMIGNSIGCALAGAAGTLIGIYYQSCYPTMGATLSMKAFTSATLGGLTSVPFAALGGILIGIIENIGIAFSSASFRDMFSFGFLILMLIFKPTGFARKRSVRA